MHGACFKIFEKVTPQLGFLPRNLADQQLVEGMYGKQEAVG